MTKKEVLTIELNELRVEFIRTCNRIHDRAKALEMTSTDFQNGVPAPLKEYTSEFMSACSRTMARYNRELKTLEFRIAHTRLRISQQ